MIVVTQIIAKMSGGLDVLALGEEDITKFLACNTHLGATNVDYQMEQYVFKRKPDGMWNDLEKNCNSTVESFDGIEL